VKTFLIYASIIFLLTGIQAQSQQLGAPQVNQCKFISEEHPDFVYRAVLYQRLSHLRWFAEGCRVSVDSEFVSNQISWSGRIFRGTFLCNSSSRTCILESGTLLGRRCPQLKLNYTNSGLLIEDPCQRVSFPLTQGYLARPDV